MTFDMTQTQVADMASRMMIFCPKCKRYVPYSARSSIGPPWPHNDLICDICGANLGDVALTRQFHRAPEGTIVVREEREESDVMRIPASQEITVLGPDAPRGCIPAWDEKEDQGSHPGHSLLDDDELPNFASPEPALIPNGCIEVWEERKEPAGTLTKADIEKAKAELARNSDPQRMAELTYGFECIERHRFDGVNPPKGTIDVWSEREES